MSDAPTLRDASAFPDLFRPRPLDSHKGSFGTVGVLGGGPGMTGAALLAARSALMCGAGKVLVGFTQAGAPLACDPLQPELMCTDIDSLLTDTTRVDAWAAGCGAGQSDLGAHALQSLIDRPNHAALVLDADALNLLASGRIQATWTSGSVIVLTPHPAEAARLAKCSVQDIQADRCKAARSLAQRFGAWIVLKGAHTVVCSPEGTLTLNGSGNPGLATPGAGDVLGGMLASLLAQGVPVEQAVRGGVWLHGAAADVCVAQGVGPIGLTAGELAPRARALRNRAVPPQPEDAA